MNIEREYEYKPKWWGILLCGSTAITSILLSIDLLLNQGGFHFQAFSQSIEVQIGLKILIYWSMLGFSIWFLGFTLGLLVQRLTYKQRVAITSVGLLIPTSRWSNREKLIRYQDISTLSVLVINGQRTSLQIKHKQGKDAIAWGLLPSKVAFEELCLIVTERVNAESYGL